MTTSYLDPAPVIDLVRTSLRSSAWAWDDALTAALEQDARGARRVLRGEAARRSGLRFARRRIEQHPDAEALRTSRLVVDDLARVDRLLNQLAQDVLGPGDGLPVDCLDHVEVVRTVGARRLLDLARTLPMVGVDAGYVRDGHRIVRAWTRLHDRPTGDVAVCAHLAASLVDVSRHATGTV